MDVTIPPDQRDALLFKAKDILWRRGDLDFKRHATQQKIQKAWRDSKARTFFYLCSRRMGKSHNMLLTAIETCIQKHGARVLYLAPHGSDAAMLASDIMDEILLDCPQDLRPHWNEQKKQYTFESTQSTIRFRGTNDDNAKYLRGSKADLIILDEAAFMDDLKYLVNDVCRPMTATTKGKILLATTPARTPSHYSTELYELLAQDGAVASYTVLDAVHLDAEEKAHMLRGSGEAPEDVPAILAGEMEPKTTTAQREYFCRFVTDSSSAVFPEFTKKAQSEIVTAETVVPDYRDLYVSMDVGSIDKTAILYAWYDFLNGKIIIEDESLLTNPSTKDIADTIKLKETMLWGKHGVVPAPYMRVSDVDHRLIKDLQQLYGLSFSPTRKDDSLGAINWARDALQKRQVVIHPRCKNLIRQLQNAVWNTTGKDFARSKEKDSPDIHYDLAAAFKYLIRAVHWARNPYPSGYHRPTHASHLLSYRVRKRGGELLRRDTPIGKRLSGESLSDPFVKKPTKR